MSPGNRCSPSMSDLVEALWSLGDGPALPATLLGIGPVSENTVRAALEAGREGDFPVIFIASRNQVDRSELGGGYVQGWDQQGLGAAIRRFAAQTGFSGLLYVCRDHGGPWQRDDEYQARLPLGQAMASAIASYQEDIAAGFDVLHIDPTRDPFADGPVSIGVAAERVLELMRECQRCRQQSNAGSLSYEVGTEESAGGISDPGDFEAFLATLLRRLDQAGLPRPAFVVGQTGTLLRMRQNVGAYNAQAARTLAAIARRYGLGLKEHNADYLSADDLQQHRAWGITGVNVAPAFGHAETAACLELAALERQHVARPSGFARLLQDAAWACGRWRKWLLPEHKGLGDDAVCADPDLLREAVVVSGHYVLDQPDVSAARQRMYQNLHAAGIAPDPERYVLERIRDDILGYARPLGLIGLTSKLRQALGAH